jgi:hypothetical protein
MDLQAIYDQGYATRAAREKNRELLVNDEQEDIFEMLMGEGPPTESSGVPDSVRRMTELDPTPPLAYRSEAFRDPISARAAKEAVTYEDMSFGDRVARIADIERGGSIPADLAGVKDEMFAAVVAMSTFTQYEGLGRPRITSGVDRPEGSTKVTFHPVGYGLDFGVRYRYSGDLWPEELQRDAVAYLNQKLGRLGFEAVLESNPPHIHVELQSRPARSALRAKYSPKAPEALGEGVGG